MKVSEIMSKDVRTVTVPGNRDDVIEVFKELEVSTLPVLKKDSRELVGMVRLRDILENPDESQLAMLVDREISTTAPEESLESAASLMLKSDVRLLPVVKEEEFKGLIAVRDILARAFKENEEEIPVLDCMQDTVTTLWNSTPLNVALETIHLSGKRALPVLDDNAELVGMIGDEDIIEVSEVEEEEKRELLRGGGESERWTWDSEDRLYITKRSLKPPEMTVEEVMSSNLITATKRTLVSRCAEQMLENEVNQIPILEGKKLKGIVSDVDLLKALTA